ncbi:uncharacterized protein LOC128547868 isoform X2 [Mercenaria mercenaria]|uniref:uncharacterized protein LOC128547868 isoform X2 n=1 Tax=Mercenaria mercenaria TaxID=6596 RepID=UPI00234F0E0D|nr:uncharacterized protein LOC128547868 isoform X2 [Mercenaria mercenaria]
MNKVCVLLFGGLGGLGGLFTVVCETRTVTVTSSTCDGTYSISKDDPLYLDFLGASLASDCKFSVSAGVSKTVCSAPVHFDVDCETELKYYKTFHSSSYIPDKRYGCNNKQTDDFCADTSQTLHVVFKNNATSSTSTINLKFHTTDDFVSDIIDSAVTTVYAVIGIVIGMIVLTISVAVIVIFFFCRRRRSHAGAVYRDQQPSVATTPTATDFAMQQPSYTAD